VAVNAADHIAQQCVERAGRERHGARVRHEARRQPVVHCREHGHAERFSRLGRHAIGEDVVGREAQVCMLLGAADRKHGAVFLLEQPFDLGPVEIGDAHEAAT
jgi:hypothetical protein